MRARREANNTVDLSTIIEPFKEKYKNIYIFQFEEQVFIYHSIGRRDYRELVNDESYSVEDREEILCKKCVIYPKNYDFENCEEAGLPTRLSDEIVKNSYLSTESRDRVLAHYRSEMTDADNQINCLIMSAFPTLNLEEIENWDVVTAAKYLSRAEWMLHNINGLPMREPDPGTTFTAPPSDTSSSYTLKTTEVSEEDFANEEMIQSTASKKAVDHNGKPKGKTTLTPEKLRELQAKYPEIDWSHDEVTLHGIEGITNQPEVDDTPVALRPRKKSK